MRAETRHPFLFFILFHVSLFIFGSSSSIFEDAVQRECVKLPISCEFLENIRDIYLQGRISQERMPEVIERVLAWYLQIQRRSIFENVTSSMGNFKLLEDASENEICIVTRHLKEKVEKTFPCKKKDGSLDHSLSFNVEKCFDIIEKDVRYIPQLNIEDLKNPTTKSALTNNAVTSENREKNKAKNDGTKDTITTENTKAITTEIDEKNKTPNGGRETMTTVDKRVKTGNLAEMKPAESDKATKLSADEEEKADGKNECGRSEGAINEKEKQESSRGTEANEQLRKTSTNNSNETFRVSAVIIIFCGFIF